MYYFLKKTDFNLENYDFDIEFSTRLTKKEQKLLKLLLKSYSKDEDFSKVRITSLPFEEDEVKKLIENLMKKTFNCKFETKVSNISTFYFNIFSIIAIEREELIYDFSDGVKRSFKEHNIFSRVGIRSHLHFTNPSTKIIYNILLKENKHKGYINLPVTDLKILLGMTESTYPRFYDFETKVLKPISRDIEISENYIWFEKIKETNSNRITAVRLHYSNIYHVNLHRETNKLLRTYAEYIEDFSLAYKKIYQHLKENNLEITSKALEDNNYTFFKS